MAARQEFEQRLSDTTNQALGWEARCIEEQKKAEELCGSLQEEIVRLQEMLAQSARQVILAVAYVCAFWDRNSFPPMYHQQGMSIAGLNTSFLLLQC